MPENHECYGCGNGIEDKPYIHIIATLHKVVGDKEIPFSRTDLYSHPKPESCQTKRDERFYEGFLVTLEEMFRPTKKRTLDKKT